MQIQISAVIITMNEERNIGRCLDSLKEVADEVIVVDSGSTDATEQICKSKGATFVFHAFEGHIQQKNHAVSLANYPVVLSLDADEALTPELSTSINLIKGNMQAEAYSMNRLTNYCGKWIRYCGWYPDTKIRLWRKGVATWGGVNPHDHIILNKETPLNHLKGDLLHYSFYTIADHVNTANKFSEIAAKEAVAKGKRANLFIHVILNPIYTFLNKYFLRLGILDGYYGFVVCMLSAVSNFLKYTKIRQFNQQKDEHQ